MESREAYATALRALVKSYISETFVIAEEEAARLADGYAVVSEGHADPDAVPALELGPLEKMINEDVGRNHTWRSEAKKQAWLKQLQDRFDAYNSHIDAQRKSPFKKW